MASATVYYNAGTGNWETAANWKGLDGTADGVLPTSSDLVYLGGLNYSPYNGPGNPQVTVTSTTAVAGTVSLLDAGLTINSGALLTATSLNTGPAQGTGGSITVNGTLTAREIVIGSGGGNGTLTLNAGGVLNVLTVRAGSGTVNLNGGTINATPGTAYVGQTTDVIAGGLTVNLTGNTTINATSTADTYLTSGMQGTGGITKTGSGDLVLRAGSSTYSGDTIVNGGMLSAGTTNTGFTTGLSANSRIVLNNSTTLSLEYQSGNGPAPDYLPIYSGYNATIGGLSGGAGTLVNLSSGALTISQATNETFGGLILGAGGSLVKTGVGTLTLSGSNTYTGNTSVNGGTLSVGALANLGAGTNVNLNGGTLQSTGTFTLSRASVLGSTGGTFEVTGSNTLSHSGVVSGAGKLTKTGTGTLTLAGTNTFTGGIAINAGVLAYSADNQLGASTGGITFNGGTLKSTFSNTSNRALILGASGGTIEVTNSADLVNEQGVISGAGSLTKTGLGKVAFSGANTYTGGTIFNAGTISVSDDTALGASTGSLTFNGGILQSTGSLTMNRATTLQAGGGTLEAATGFITQQGIVSGIGALTKTGTQTLTLSAANTFTGNLTVAAGLLKATSDAGALGAGNLILSGGNLALANDTGLNFGRNTTVSADATITSDRLTGGAGVTHTLGTLSIGAHTLSTAAGSNVTSDTAGLTFGAVTFTANGAVFDTAASTLLKLGALGGNFTFAKQGAGQLTLSNASSRTTAGTTLSAGTLRLETANALSTSSAGTLALSGGTLVLANDSATTFNGTATTLGGNVTVTSDRLTAGGGMTHTLGTLSAGGQTLSITAGSLATSGTSGITYGATTLTAAGTVFDTGLSTLLKLGAIGGNFSFTKQGAGQLTLATAGTRTGGGTTLTAGTLRLEAGDALGTGSGALALNGGNFQVASDGPTTFHGTDTTLGVDTTITSDRLTAGGGVVQTLGTLTIGAHKLSTAAGSHVTSGTSGLTFGAVTLTADGAVFETAASTLLNLGAIGGNFSFTKQGAGRLTLGSASTRTSGSTTVTAGTLRLENGDALGTNATGVLNLNGATLEVAANADTTFHNTAIVTSGNQSIISDRITSGAGVTQTLGTLTIGNDTITTAAGANVSSGVAGLTFGKTTFTGAGATFAVGANSLLTLGSLDDGGTAKALIKSGAGTLTLATAATSQVNGTALNVTAGTVNLSNAALGTLANVTVTGATLNIGDAETLGALNGSGAVALGANHLTIGSTNNLDSALSGIISGTGALTKDGTGTLTLSGANSYSGGTTVSAGTLVGDTTSLQGAITNNAAVLFNQATLGTYSAIMSGTGTLTKLGAGKLILGGANSYSGGTTVTAGTLEGNTTSLQGAITNNAAVNFNQATDGTYGSVMNGTGSLTKLGAGKLILTGANSYSGGTTVSAGTLQGDTTSLQGPIQNDAALIFNQATLGTFASSLSGIGSLTKQGAGTLILSGGNTYSGGTTVSTGTLQGDSNSLQGAITNNATLIFDQTFSGNYGAHMSGIGALIKQGAGKLTLSGSNSYSGGTTVSAGTLEGNTTTLQGAITNNAAVNFNQATAGTYSSIMIGTGSLTKLGVGTLTLSGANTYSGGTTVTTGTLQGDTTSLQGAITNNAAVNFNQLTDGTYSSIMDGTGSLTKLGAGKLILTGANTYGGGTTVTAGTLQGDTTSLQGAITNNAAVLFNQATLGTYSSIMIGTGSLTKQGAGTLVLSGANSYSGGTTVSAGTLQGDATSLQGAITNNAAVTFNQAVAGTYAGNMIGTGALKKQGAGKLTLGGTNSYSGGTTVTAGTLEGNTTSLQGAIQNDAAVNFNQATAGTYSSIMNGTGSLTKLGAGTLTLGAANTYTGATTVSAGKLRVDGSLAANSAVTIQTGATLGGSGTIGGDVLVQNGGKLGDSATIETLHISGDTTFNAGSTLSLAGNNATFDQIVIGGAVSIQSGALIDLSGTWNLSSYTLLTADSGLDGIKFTLAGAMPAGYQLNYTATSLILAFQPEIGTITATPDVTTVITGGSTPVTVTVDNSVASGGSDLNPTATGSGNASGTGTTTAPVAPGDTGTIDPTLTFTGTTVGTGQTGTVTVTDPDASNNPQTTTVTVDVLDHAAPALTVVSGNNQNVIVDATGVTAAFNLANGTTGQANLSPMDVTTLSSNLSGATGAGVIASGSSGNYTGSLDTTTVGAGQTQTFSLKAGDEQTIPGANPLTTQSSDITLNVYGHADGSLSGNDFDLGKVHLAYTAPILSAAQTVTNGSAGDYIVDLKAAAVTNGNVSVNAISGVGAGDSDTIKVTLATGQGVGSLDQTMTYTYADDSSYLGASTNTGTETLNITGFVYSGQGVWTAASGGSWGTIASGFGVNWQANGGTPGLDAGFTDTDTATFGTAGGGGTVTLDGAAPSLKDIIFNDIADSYTLAQGLGVTGVTLNGGASAATIQNLNGNHTISAPIIMASDLRFSVANALDRLNITGAVSGTGNVEVAGSGRTVFTQDQAYTGTTTVSGGVLASQSLASSDVTLTGGRFSPGDISTVATITVKSLSLNGGAIEMDLGAGGLGGLSGVSDNITSTNDISLNAPTHFYFNNVGFTLGLYTLLSGNLVGALDINGLLDLSGLTFSSTNIPGLRGVFGSDATGLFFQAYSSDVPLTGAVLSNSAPYLIPTDASFLVQDSVTTAPAGGSNTILALYFDPNSTLSVFNDLTVTSGNLTVNSGSAILQGGTLLTPGDFTKLGNGLLNVLSNVITAGNTIVNAGTLAVNGQFTTNTLMVDVGAWLKGRGIINGNVVNQGTVAPGNSPGTLTVNGNFTQTKNGTLQIEVANNTFDRLVVSGKATLAGTLQAIAYGGHKFQYGDKVPFLQAGSISGSFDNILMPTPSKLRGRFITKGGTGTLVVAPASYMLVAEGQNQKNVARALNAFIGKKGDRDTVSTALDIQTKGQYSSAFDQIAPGFYQTLTDIVIEQTNAQNQFLAQRISSARMGATGFTVTGLDQAALSVDRNGKDVLDAKSGKDIISQGTTTKWGVWVQGNGIFAHVTNVAQVPNYHYNSGGFMVGADYTFGGDKVTTSSTGDGKKAVITSNTVQGSTLVLGIYGGYQGTYSKYNSGARTSINSALFGGYASYSNGGFYSDAIVGGSYNNYQASRTINFSTIDRTGQSNPYGGTVTAYLDAGYDFHAGNFTFGPLLSGQYTYAGTAPFSETGADSLDLRVSQQNASSLRTNVGGQISYNWAITDHLTLIPSARIFWQHEYLDGSRTIGASLDGGNGPGFDFQTSDPSRDSVFAGIGVSAFLGDRWNASLYYNADFGRQDFISHMISTSVGWKF